MVLSQYSMGLYFYLLILLFILSLKNMSDIAKNLFEKNKTKYLEGDSSVEELINRYNATTIYRYIGIKPYSIQL